MKGVPKKKLNNLPEKKEIKKAIKENKSVDDNLVKKVKEFNDF